MNIIGYKPPFGEKNIYRVGDSSLFTDSLLSDVNGVDADVRGFVVAPFNLFEEPLFYPVDRLADNIPDNIIAANRNEFIFPEHDETFYFSYIDKIKESLGGDLARKVVASRRKRLECENGQEINPDSLFSAICESYPEAYVFFISTREWGTWIGASPELLLKKEGKVLTTMSLAGTRPAGTMEEWDEKNVREQQIVTSHIENVFMSEGLGVATGETLSKRAGNIEHIMTPVSGMIIDKEFQLRNLLKNLSPTPALAGFPRSSALDLISSNEGDRKLYGGFFGPVCGEDFTFNVILRCAFLDSPFSAVLFAGGGVTAMSDPHEEWRETERKLNTLSPFFEPNWHGVC